MDTTYRSAQHFATLWTVMPLSSLVIAAVLWFTGDPNARLGIGIVLSTTVFTLLVMGRLVVQIRGEQLLWHFGWLGIPRWRLPLADITACEVARGTAAGAGIKGTRQLREYTAAVGSPGVRLTLKDGSGVFLGSPEPERLRAFLEARVPALQQPTANRTPKKVPKQAPRQAPNGR
jgi:hypothetical protein